MEIEINYTFSVTEANTILAGLAKLPFENVADLITRIRDEGKKQFDAAQAEVAKTLPLAAELQVNNGNHISMDD